MAAAIARHACRALENGPSFKSAGILASSGAPITTEAGIALGEKEIPFSHESQRLTKETLAETDIVFAMEQRHCDAVTELIGELSPPQCPEIRLVSKDGGVPDPLGHPLHTYRELADFLIEEIPARLVETGLISTRADVHQQ